MPNIGFDSMYREILSLESPVPIILNIAGFSPLDYQVGAGWSVLTNVSAVTLNFGCPNKHDHRTVPIAYDLESMKLILDAVASTAPEKPIWIKLSPYLTMPELEVWREKMPQLDFDATPTVEDGFLEEVLNLIVPYRFVRALIFGNTLGNVVYRQNDGTTATSPNGGQAGLSGPPLKDLSLDLIRRASRFLMGSNVVDLIGCGGILTGQDVIDYLEAGAQGVQCVSGPSWHPGGGAKFFADLVNDSPELQDYLTTNTN
jgi:dihydroorotate dehydrogenase